MADDHDTRGPVVLRFPVAVPPGFVAFEKEPPVRWDGRPCPTNDSVTPLWGGGFNAKRGRFLHKALDIMAPTGALVRSVGHGMVVERWTVKRGDVRPGAGYHDRSGFYVVVADPGGFEWYYAHLLREPQVAPGDVVTAGQWLGEVGRTGNASRQTSSGRYGCPHLHIRVQSGASPFGRKVDPEPLLEPLFADHKLGPWPKGWLRLTHTEKPRQDAPSTPPDEER